MNPAFSVVFFTSTSGAGYGLLFATALLLAVDAFPGGGDASLAALALAFVLIVAGLVSSTLHLGHPERAWRALSQWRSSWLSREGVAAIVTFVPHLALAALLATGRGSPLAHTALALACAAGAVLTVLCTARIYASLRAIRQWHHRLVTPVYLAFGLMSGLVWLLVVLRLSGSATPQLATAAALALAAGWALKLAYWRDIRRDSGSVHTDGFSGARNRRRYVSGRTRLDATNR